MALSPSMEQKPQQSLMAKVLPGLLGLAAGLALVLWLQFGSEKVPDKPGSGKPGAGQPVTATPTAKPVTKPTAVNWTRFRGPEGAGVSPHQNVPTSWNGKTGEGILWKMEVPLPGMNSPVIWGDRVFLCGADASRREIYCFDAKTGELLWRKAVVVKGQEEAPPLEAPEDTGLAAPTMTTDGRRAFAIFANGDIAAVDFDGKLLWSRSFGPLDNGYGHSSSLEMAGGRLIVLMDQAIPLEGLSSIMALNAGTGEIVWETGRDVPASWASPVLIHTAAGGQIITCADPWVIAYDPIEGKEIWRVECLAGDIASTPIYAGALVLAISPSEKIVAIRPDGRGNTTKTHVAWSVEDILPDISSPVSDGRLVWTLATGGTLNCYNLADGKTVWTKELDSDFWSSPSLAGGKLYMLDEDGVMFIAAAGSEFKELGRAALGEKSRTCPAFQDGRIYIRGEKHLFCIGVK